MSGLRIIAGSLKGRKLIAPEGVGTRPTNIRARQALFDMLMHASWAGREFLARARVLDVFAGTGAFGLEALSRGAAAASFIENAPPALAALRANIAACRVAAQVYAADALNPPAGPAHDLVFLDPPYGQNFVPRAVAALAAKGWVAMGALMIAELGQGDEFTPNGILATRSHGPAQFIIWR